VQAVPSGSFDHALVEVEGVHTSHAFEGFTEPAAWAEPPMTQKSKTHAAPASEFPPTLRFGAPGAVRGIT
jgi:hypothetical protein